MVSVCNSFLNSLVMSFAGGFFLSEADVEVEDFIATTEGERSLFTRGGESVAKTRCRNQL